MGLLDGKVAIITGAGSGMAQATAKLFLKEGAKVVAVDIREQSLKQYDNDDNALAVPADITNNEDLDRIVDSTLKKFGTIHILCNMAGINDMCLTLEEADEALFDRIMNIDLKAPFMLSKKVVEIMKENHTGAIVNISSYAGLRGNHGPCYTAAKTGLIGLTRSMACGLIEYGIRTNCITPGGINTNNAEHSAELSNVSAEKANAGMGGRFSEKGWNILMSGSPQIPGFGWGEPEDIANAMLFLCSDFSKHVNGVILPVDKGTSCS